MSEEPNQALPRERSFEERVFIQFDAMNKRFDSIDARLQKLEAGAEQKAFDTKPIWERALAEILETRQDVGILRTEVTELSSQVTELRSEVKELRSEVVELRSEVVELRSEVTELRSETKEGFRNISRKLVIIFDDIVQLRADQLHAGNRLDKLEFKPM